ncbi:hypothetical protein M3P05_16305 [Sansalvadorimonas sp. 2012CJ34-2]|uniref:Uncharacterized protein n=1 Tax=Parendozoicomonas callyspongiae TaxID=2942213 RepID=A0ABT0PJG6_9GAMM|nr:hypothetical protein [Sansalvadorimonas sp. 2012CJ34-2]MCL6271484.1 hypothetical protein [Sansalvadorimonas sp. 2012CJ34-2]
MSATFNVIFSGKIAPGANEQKVKNLAMKAFHASPEQLAKLFSGKAVVLKSNLSQEAAQNFVKKLKGIGLVCEIRKKSPAKAQEQPEQPAVEPKPTKPKSIPETDTPVAPKASSTTWDIAPVGTDINPLKAPEPPPAPDTSQFEIKPHGDYLLEPNDSPAPEAPDTSRFSIKP